MVDMPAQRIRGSRTPRHTFVDSNQFLNIWKALRIQSNTVLEIADRNTPAPYSASQDLSPHTRIDNKNESDKEMAEE